MKTRIISALVGLIILGVAIAFYDTIIFNLFITALAVIGIYEGHHAASLTKKHWRVTLYSMLFAVLILLIPHGRSYIMPAVYALVVLVFAYIPLLISLLCSKTKIQNQPHQPGTAGEADDFCGWP